MLTCPPWLFSENTRFSSRLAVVTVPRVYKKHSGTSPAAGAASRLSPCVARAPAGAAAGFVFLPEVQPRGGASDIADIEKVRRAGPRRRRRRDRRREQLFRLG